MVWYQVGAKSKGGAIQGEFSAAQVDEMAHHIADLFVLDKKANAWVVYAQWKQGQTGSVSVQPVTSVEQAVLSQPVDTQPAQTAKPTSTWTEADEALLRKMKEELEAPNSTCAADMKFMADFVRLSGQRTAAGVQ